MSCAECYYRKGGAEKILDTSYYSCDYILYTRESRNCEVRNCEKFLPLEQDRNSNKGCGSCEFNDFVNEDYRVCRITNEEVWSYKPSCKAFYKKKMARGVKVGNL